MSLGLRKPKRSVPGVDLAGRVEAVGRNEEGKLAPVVTRTYPLREAARAVRELEELRAQGKVVIAL